jgi:hypothetical protein
MKSKCRLLRKGWLVGIATLCGVGTFQVSALADQMAEDDTFDLTIIDEDQGSPLEDVQFYIYRVGEMTDPETIELEPEYEEACVYLEPDEMDSWAADANTLDAYLLLRDMQGAHIDPIASGTTDEEGCLEVEALEEGVYLITGDMAVMDDTIYTPSASLLLLSDEDDGIQTLDDGDIGTTVYVKNGNRPMQDESVTVSLSAVKVWRDKEDLENRPTSVSLVLFENGEEYAQVELNQENNWRYTWEELSPNSDWKLMEMNVPTEHTVTVEFDGSIFVVTNTKRSPSDRLGDIAEGTIPPNPGTTEETTTKAQVTPGGGTGDSGVIWKLIPVLGFAGVVLVISGWGIRRKADEKHEK